MFFAEKCMLNFKAIWICQYTLDIHYEGPVMGPYLFELLASPQSHFAEINSPTSSSLPGASQCLIHIYHISHYHYTKSSIDNVSKISLVPIKQICVAIIYWWTVQTWAEDPPIQTMLLEKFIGFCGIWM